MAGDILRDFIGLRGGNFERNVTTFALRYGTLKLCEHDRPMFHKREDVAADPAAPWACREVASSVVGWDFEERLPTWRRFSLQAQALWNMAEALRRERRVANADLDVLYPDGSRAAKQLEQIMLVHAPELNVDTAAATSPKFVIQATLQDWLRFGGDRIDTNHPRKGRLSRLFMQTLRFDIRRHCNCCSK
jgi:hypothetical protein